jgi:hypothetical protein
LSGDNFRGLCDHTFWHNSRPFEDPKFSNGDLVFCKIDEVWRLFRASRRTRKRIVLVTGEGDKPVTNDLWAQKPPHVVSWFGTNMFVDHPMAHPIPLGLGNANGTVTLQWSEIQSASKNPPARDGLLYSNFGTFSNPPVREPLLHWVSQPSQSWITQEPHNSSLGKPGYLKQLLSHRFVLCPPGNGEDTHRMWEALYCGAVPVVRKSPAMRSFQDLPILFVEDFNTVSPQLLEERSKDMSSISSQKLDFQHWTQRIAEKRQSCLLRGALTHTEWLQAWFAEIFRLLKGRLQ